MTFEPALTDYDLGFIAGIQHAVDCFLFPDPSTTEETTMPKKTRPTRAQQTRQMRALANSVNAAFTQIAHEIDQLRTVTSAIAEVQGISDKVVEHIKAGQARSA